MVEKNPGGAANGQEKDAQIDLPNSEEVFRRVTKGSRDAVGLVALANIVIAAHKKTGSVDIPDQIASLTDDAIEVYRAAALPALEARDDQVRKAYSSSENMSISDHPLYLKLTQYQDGATGVLTEQIRGLEKLVRERTNLWVQLGVGVAGALILGIFVIVAQLIAPTTVFYALQDHTPVAQNHKQ